MKLRVALLWLATAACEAGESPAPLLEQPGDPCRTSASWCVDEERALECIEGVWTERSCEQSCSERGPKLQAEGCAPDPDTLLDGCVCVPEPGACAPGATQCESDTQLRYCDAEQVWIVYECSELCAASLATPISLGCDVDEQGLAACWCEAED